MTSWLARTSASGLSAARSRSRDPQVAAQARALSASRPQISSRITGPHQPRRPRLQPRLHAGADHAGGLHFGRCEMSCSHRPGGGGPQIGEVAIVEKHRLDQPGFRGEQDHQPVQAWQSQCGIVEEAGADLDGKPAHARDVGGFHVHLALRLGELHRHHRRHHHAPVRQRAEGCLDHVHGLGVECHRPAQLRLCHDPDVMRHNVSPRSPSRPERRPARSPPG